MKKLSVIIPIVLISGIILQVVYLFVLFDPDLISVRNNLGRSSIWRGANFNHSGKVADFVVFLNHNIPENARVVLPTLGRDRKILTTPYMQFFLAPREVINCPNIDCLQTVMGDNTYILLVGRLPESIINEHTSLMFDDNWGILLPEDSMDAEIPPTVNDFSSLKDLLSSAVGPFLWVTVLTLSGTLMVWIALPGWQKILQLSLGYGAGLGIFSLGMVALGLFGVSLTRWTVILTTSIMLGATLIVFWLGSKSVRRVALTRNQKLTKTKVDAFPLVFLGIGFLAAIFAVGKGYHWIDAIQIWGVKGYGIAADGTIDHVTDWGTNTLGYPLHIPILIAAFRILFGDILPASKMLFAGYYLALILLLYSLLLELNVRRWFSGLAVLLLMLSPIIFRHATIGYANLPLSYYLVGGIGVFILAMEFNRPRLKLLLSSFLFVCAAWTRAEGLNLVTGAIIFLVLIGLWRKPRSLGWKEFFVFLLPLFFYIPLWQIIKARIYTEPFRNSDLISIALTHFKLGDFHFDAIFFTLLYFIQDLLSIRIFGGVGIFLLFSVLLLLFSWKSLPRSTWILIAVGSLWIAMIVGMYYVLSYSSTNDLSWWLSSGFTRMDFPGLIVLFLGLITAIQNVLPPKSAVENHSPQKL